MFTSCSVKELPPLEMPLTQYQNTLTRNGGAISVPDNFTFFLKRNEQKTIIARFEGGGIDGIYEKLKYRYAMSNEKLTRFYIEKILDGAKNITIRKSADKRDIYIVTAISKDREKEIVTTLYLKNSKTLYLLQLTSKTGVLSTNKKLAYSIISSMKSADQKLNLRKKNNFASFICPDNSFRWYGDLKKANGFKLFGRENRSRISISKNRYKNFNQISSEHSKKYSVKTFETFFADSKKRSKVISIINYSKKYSAIIFIRNRFLYKVRYRKRDDLKPKEIIKSQLLLKLFSFIKF